MAARSTGTIVTAHKPRIYLTEEVYKPRNLLRFTQYLGHWLGMNTVNKGQKEMPYSTVIFSPNRTTVKF